MQLKACECQSSNRAPLHMVFDDSDVKGVKELLDNDGFTPIHLTLPPDVDPEFKASVDRAVAEHTRLHYFDPLIHPFPRCCRGKDSKSESNVKALLKCGTAIVIATILGFFWFKGGSKVPHEISIPTTLPVNLGQI